MSIDHTSKYRVRILVVQQFYFSVSDYPRETNGQTWFLHQHYPFVPNVMKNAAKLSNSLFSGEQVSWNMHVRSEHEKLLPAERDVKRNMDAGFTTGVYKCGRDLYRTTDIYNFKQSSLRVITVNTT